MLNFMLKVIQKRLCGMRELSQWSGKFTQILPPARAVAGHAANGQRRQHHANAK